MYKLPPLKEGVFIRRYKRFFVDVMTDDGVITVHNPNTGSMRSLLKEGNQVLYSTSDNPKRKLPCTLELINVEGEWIVSNTVRVNSIVEAALKAGAMPELYTGGEIRREFSYKDSRIDFLLGEKTLVEVKSVTYFDGETSYFPDAVTSRGLKHLQTLSEAVKEGYRAVMLYVCMADKPYFACAADIDPAYNKGLEEAVKAGVEKTVAHAFYENGSMSVKSGTVKMK